MREFVIDKIDNICILRFNIMPYIYMNNFVL